MKEEEKAAYLAKIAAQKSEMKRVVADVLATESGKRMFLFLHNVCGWNTSSLVLNQTTGEVDPVGTTFNEARRTVYLRLRELAPVAVLKEVEYNEKEENK